MALILNDWEQIVVTAPWTARRLHRVVSDGTYMYLTGGNNTNESPNKFSDVWRSADGETWAQLTADGGYGKRSAHGFIYYNNRFYIMGGSDENNAFLNDIWVSDDCITWERIVENADWAVRHEFALAEWNGRVWLTGGFRTGTFYGGAWQASEDLTSWTQTQANIMGAGFREHVSVAFLNKLWVIGGDVSGYGYVDWLFSSVDGITWVDEGDAAWDDRREHQLVMDIEEETIAIVGGYDDDAKNDVWQSTDGVLWTEIAQLNSFTVRSDHGMVNHRGRTFITGGYDGAEFLGDVWVSDYALFCDFVASPTSGNASLAVSFTPEVTGTPTSYLWTFGDGFTSTEADPTHTYTVPGRYTVSLYVENAASDYTETKQNYITVGLDFTGVPRIGQAPLNVEFRV